MASWSEFEASAPDFGAAARRLFIGSDGLAIGFLAAVSARGAAHLSPVCPIFTGEHLYLSAGAHTPKAADLRGSGAYVSHAFLAAHDEELQLGGRALELHDPAERAAVHAAIPFAAFETSDPIFRLAIERALWVYWERVGQPDTKAVRLAVGPGRDAAMSPDAGRRAEHERFRRINAAFRAGDLAALRAAVGDPDVVPNGPMPLAIGPCLEYAIYHSPLGFIRTLLEIGADPNPEDHAGFPPLLAALSCSRSQPGSPARADVAEILELLLAFGADPHLPGINDYNALHLATAEADRAAVEILLAAGADPRLRTRIDDCETPRELAEKAGLAEIASLLAAREAELQK